MTSQPPARPPRAARRALALALALGALGAALALVSGGRTWASGTASFAQGALPVTASGTDITALPGALALVGLAALVAVFAVRGAARVVVAALLALCGAGTLAAALLGSRDTSALREAAARTSGLSDSGVAGVTVGVWPYVAACGGLLILLAGLLALRHGRHWPAMTGSGRYARTPRRAAQRPATVDPDRPEDLWKALDRGEDPTRPAP